ncbi:FAD-dependent oxidoreductase [Peribacillus cavernae]|nr:FAD-dependent oxidoreductase [Peribacillus cavernae]MDQ0221064.1 2,4-dienoyl-CoA reductase-like NADH-dependent reductase (Old Yellow Enzyme family)/thioredoxin reductase [Peribacillus cavernae]
MTTYPLLFSPLKLGNKTLRNRMAMVELVTNYAEQQQPTERNANFYAERAKGGVALIVTEGLSVHPTSVPQPHVPAAYLKENIEKFRSIADSVHQHGTILLGQLWHVGRQQLWSPMMSPWGVSALPCPLSNAVPHEMSVEDINEIVESFVLSARNLKEAGFDGVSLHGAHGYLITQFLSPWSNKRRDQYGGSIENRARFVVDIINRIHETCGDDFIVGIKLTVHEYVEGGLDLEESKILIQHIIQHCKVDYIGVSQGNFSFSLEYHVADMHFPPTPFIHLAEEVKKISGNIPVMGMGKITDPETAEKLIVGGSADLIGLGRALISDAEFANKAATNPDNIRECTSCNICWGEIHGGKPLVCMHNPEAGYEKEYGMGTLTRTSLPKKVVVVGGGPAGLEAARIAAARGHHVMLIEKQPELGGQLLQAAKLPGRENLTKTLSFLTRELKRHNVEIRLKEVADEDFIDAIQPDVVIIAAGSTPNLPEFENRSMRVHSFVDSINMEEWGDHVVIFDDDGDIPPYALAEKIATLSKNVTIVTKKPQLAKEANYLSWIGINRRIRSFENITFFTSHKIVQIKSDGIEIQDVFGGQPKYIGCSDVVMVTRNSANNIIYQNLKEKYETYNIGDSYAPRKILAAIHEAHRVARTI